MVALALRYAVRRVPREMLVEAWPGEPRLLERLIGPPPPSQPNPRPQTMSQAGSDEQLDPVPAATSDGA